MKPLTVASLFFSSITGCLVVPTEGSGGNAAPYVTSADAFVSFDPYYGDDIWTFEAWVDDPDGPLDIVGVWADVYDDLAGGQYIESFDLLPTNDARYWWSEWLGSSTHLDPYWYGYSADVFVNDAEGRSDVLTVSIATY